MAMTFPLRMVQAKATADAEQPCAAPMCEWDHAAGAVGAAERRTGHQRHVTLLAPWQQVMFNTAVAEIVRVLIGGAATAIGTWKRFSMSLTLKFETPHAGSKWKASRKPSLRGLWLIRASVPEKARLLFPA
jgi:hypothetical protein